MICYFFTNESVPTQYEISSPEEVVNFIRTMFPDCKSITINYPIICNYYSVIVDGNEVGKLECLL